MKKSIIENYFMFLLIDKFLNAKSARKDEQVQQVGSETIVWSEKNMKKTGRKSRTSKSRGFKSRYF